MTVIKAGLGAKLNYANVCALRSDQGKWIEEQRASSPLTLAPVGLQGRRGAGRRDPASLHARARFRVAVTSRADISCAPGHLVYEFRVQTCESAPLGGTKRWSNSLKSQHAENALVPPVGGPEVK
jgi:hypothetical protein